MSLPLTQLMSESLEAKDRELEQLRAIVDKLPKTADGVPVVPGMMVWRVLLSGSLDYREVVSIISSDVVSLNDIGAYFGDLYSTREAAEKARTS